MRLRAHRQRKGGTAMHTPETITSVVKAVLEHGVASTDQRLVCTMAMVCRGWRVAVRDKAPARPLDVSLEVGNRWAPDDAGMPSECMLKLASFSKWLPQHAVLVRKLKVSGHKYSRPDGEDDKDITWFKALAETIFSLALRSAAAACIGPSAQQQLQPLGLQSYSSNVLDISAVLQSVPMASLTELVIIGSDPSALAAALPRLANLQRLQVHGADDKPLPAVLQAAQQLSALTELSFPDIISSDVKLVPPHLLRLEVCVLGDEVVDFSHMTRLKSLSIKYSWCAGYKFPAQLVELSIEDISPNMQGDGLPVVSISNISSLKCLESLQIGDSKENAVDLLQLVALPELQKLSLHYRNTETALAASAAWPKLRQLQGVDLSLKCSSPACMQLFSNLGKVTWLTQLHAFFRLAEDAEQQAVPIAICSEICKLQMLTDLYLFVNGTSDELQQSSWEQDDLARLSNLTQLTRLDMYERGFGHEFINDAVVVQLLRNLKQLQDLSVPVKSVAVLPVVAGLSNLRVLKLPDLTEAVQRSGLQYLQGLKSLTALSGFSKCSKQELADFWAAVRA